VGYNFFRRHYGSIFIHLAIVAFKNRKIKEIPIKFDLIAVQGHPRSSILVSICNFLLVINSNFGPICFRFRDIDA